jgi:hypothetical protein
VSNNTDEQDATVIQQIEKHLFPRGTDFDWDKQKLLFEHYKILAQSSEQLSARRQTVNGFFLSLNTFMLAGMGFIFKESFELYFHEHHKVTRLMMLAVALGGLGFTIDINWSRLIESYGKLLQSQVRVMEALEKHTLAAVVTAQTAFHRRDFHSLSSLEKNIAHAFQAIYALSAITAILLVVFRPEAPVQLPPAK